MDKHEQINSAPEAEENKPHWRDKYQWLGLLLAAAFAFIAPVPPPKPLRPDVEYSELAEDPIQKSPLPDVLPAQEKAKDST